MAAALLSLAALVAAVRWGSFVAGGSDSYCYVALARMSLDGSIFAPIDPGFPVSWTNGPLSLVPAGFVPSPVVSGGMSPICAPGLGIAMAAAEAVGGTGAAFFVVPVFGALTVWLAFVMGRSLAGPWAGVFASLLTLTSPIFLFQLVQPMSDVPAAALWLGSIVLAARGSHASLCGAGLAAGLALVLRPNLLPLTIAPAILALRFGGTVRTWRLRDTLVGIASLGAGMLPGVVAVLLLNNAFYGSRLSSGYGDPSLLFRWAHVGPNAARYATWLLESQTPWVLLGLGAPFFLRRRAGTAEDGCAADGTPGTIATASLALMALGLVVYLPYVVFDNWSYLRFLLPGVLSLVVLAAASSVRLVRRLPAPWRTIAIVILAAVLAAKGVETASARFAFDLKLSEHRFEETGVWIAQHTPRNAVVLSVWQSGSIRLYGERFTVLWDAISPPELDLVVAELTRAGREPFLLLDTWEVPMFKERFAAHSALSGLDWPPLAQIGRDAALYRLADRERYFRGDVVPSQRVWTAAERVALRRR